MQASIPGYVAGSLHTPTDQTGTAVQPNQTGSSAVLPDQTMSGQQAESKPAPKPTPPAPPALAKSVANWTSGWFGGGTPAPAPQAPVQSSTSGEDEAYLEGLQKLINEAQEDVSKAQDIFGSMGDEQMLPEHASKKKRAIDESEEVAAKEDSAKTFYVASWRVEEVVQQIGEDFHRWLHSNFPPEEHQEQVNTYLGAQFASLTQEEKLEISVLPLKEQVPRLGNFLLEKKRKQEEMEAEAASGDLVGVSDNESFDSEKMNNL